MLLKRLILFVIFLVMADALKLPPYIKPCRLGPNLPQCAAEHANLALPELMKGDKKYHIPRLSPFQLEKIEISANNNFNITLTNVTLRGLETATISGNYIDLDNSISGGTANFKFINIQSNYNLNGRLLFLELHGSGPANLTFEEVRVVFEMKFDLVTRNGKKYIDKARPTVEWDIKKYYYDFQNLFNGNKLMGDEINKLLNENPDQLKKDIGFAISETIRTIASEIISNIFPYIPVDEIFLPAE